MMYNASIDTLLDTMTKTADLRLNETTGKWEASFAGQVFLKSASKDYVIDKIVNGISNKAKALGVSSVSDLANKPTKVLDPSLTFSIGERFMILEDLVDMTARRNIPSCVITGSGGLGKTHTVIKGLKAAGLTDIDAMEVGARMDDDLQKKSYLVIKGFSTAKALFRTLHDNRARIVIFDDCDSVLLDKDAANILKSALDSYDTRTITWNAEAFGKDDDLQRSFTFTGGVIFISNMPLYKVPQAIVSRCMVADVSMTREEIVERMTSIVRSGEFLPGVEMDIKLEVLAYVAECSTKPEVPGINLRTLIKATNTRLAKPDHWKRITLYSMLNDR
jgi:hypothetical protein